LTSTTQFGPTLARRTHHWPFALTASMMCQPSESARVLHQEMHRLLRLLAVMSSRTRRIRLLDAPHALQPLKRTRSHDTGRLTTSRRVVFVLRYVHSCHSRAAPIAASVVATHADVTALRTAHTPSSSSHIGPLLVQNYGVRRICCTPPRERIEGKSSGKKRREGWRAIWMTRRGYNARRGSKASPPRSPPNVRSGM
ncbi:hypothetical protein C8J57DRAFT_1330048, partial [Mycena rebaudengoi]